MIDYIFEVPITGYQITHVLADSREEAFDKLKNGKQAFSEPFVIEKWNKDKAEIVAE
jgi:hypothetical protein